MKAIPYIDSLNQTMELAQAMQAFYKTQDITLMLGTKPFDKLLSCKEPEIIPILIVVVATAHPHEKKVCGMPCYQQFAVFMLLFQKEPHFFLPFSTTHMNLYLGNMIKDMEYKASKTFAKYMKNNLNHKLVPIQGGCPESSKVKQQLQFDSYYTTARLAAGVP